MDGADLDERLRDKVGVANGESKDSLSSKETSSDRCAPRKTPSSSSSLEQELDSLSSSWTDDVFEQDGEEEEGQEDDECVG